MKRFVWRLQHLLEVRTKEEETKRAELLEITERLVETHGELLAQQRILEDIILGIAAETPQKRLREQEFFLKHSATNDKRIETLQTKVSELESQQQKKMTEFLKIRRFKEGLERLREEAKRRYIEEQEKLEQKELDEVANISFARTRNSIS
ncbi:MAG: flagellar FliJ family protein [Planctomycetota bacterium]|jgi:flagellar export protein FliJ